MSENEKKVAEVSTAKAETKKQKKNRVSFRERIAKGWRDYKSEMKKIVWAGPKVTLQRSVFVVVVVVIAGAVIGVLDVIFNQTIMTLAKLL